MEYFFRNTKINHLLKEPGIKSTNSLIYFFKYYGKKYVLKCLNQNNKKLQERFIRECHINDKIRHIEGVLPILEYSEKHFYHISPRGYRFSTTNHKGEKIPLIEKLRNFLPLIKTLIEIHNLDISHRDIKPKNLIWYNSRLCFIDFGISKQKEDTTITEDTEKIGPRIMLPPELVNRINDNIDYRKSDIYLLSKTLWMYVNETEHPYSGEYNVNTYITEENFKFSVEPLHQLFLNTTKSLPEERIDLCKFEEYIYDQISIIENNMNEEKKRMYGFLKMQRESFQYLNATINIFDIQKIDALKIKQINIVDKVSSNEFKIPFDIKSFSLKEQHLEFDVFYGERIIKIKCIPIHLECRLKSQNVVIPLKKIQSNLGSIFSANLMLNDSEYWLPNYYEIEIKV